MYESLFVLEIVNSTSAAQKTKMILFLLESRVSFKNPRTHYQHQRKEGTVVKVNVSFSQEAPVSLILESSLDADDRKD